jgi:hypothetical protein
MRLPKLRHLSLFLILAFFLAIWAGRAQLSELIISSSMQSLGLDKVTTDINHLGLDQSHISRFGFTLATETGLFKLEAHDISMSYTLEQLAQGRADKLAINRLELHYQGSNKTSEDRRTVREALEPLKIIATLRHALREYVIFNTFSAEHITLHGDSFATLQAKPLRLNGANNDASIYAELTLLDQSSSTQQDNLRQLVITRLSQDSLIAELRFSTTPGTVPAKLEFNIHDTDIQGNYDINPQQLKHWLQPVATINNIIGIKNVNGTLSSSFESDDVIVSTITAKSDKYAAGEYNANNIVVKLKLENPTVNPFQHIDIQNGSYIKASNFSYVNFSLGKTLINLVGELSSSAGAWQFTGGLSTKKLTIGYGSQALQLEEFATRLSSSSGKLEADGNFSTAEVPAKFSFALVHDFNKALGSLSIKPLKPLELNNENNKLSLLLTPWPYPFDLLNGSIKLSADATWSQGNDFSLTSRVNLDDAGGHYGELVFSGLSFDHAFEILPKIHSTQTGKINLKQLDSGVTASNISTSLTLETADTGALPQIAIQGLHGEIFDGTFSADNIVFDLNRSKNSFKIRTTDIDLAKIVETQQLEDIVVTGRIDGTIPVEINDQGIFIKHGAFVNDIRAGSIRYNPAAGTDQLKQNPITGITLDALKDFRYTHLSADVNFTPEGVLTVSLQLKGTSPELDTKRPVHLNINTEQNLLSLLKSLRYAQGVSESIDQKVRRQYEKNQKK